MANIKIFGAFLICLFAVATATTYTTTVTTITTSDEGSSSRQGSRQECQTEIDRQDLNRCDNLFSMEHGSGRLRMTVQRREQEQEQDQQRQCCQQLEQVRSHCRCAAIEDVVRRQMPSGQSMQSQKMQKVLDMAQNLPSACNWQQPQKCSIQTSWFA